YALHRIAAVPGVTVDGPPDAAGRGALVSFTVDGGHPPDVAERPARQGGVVRAGHHCAQPLMRCLGVGATTRASFAVHSTSTDVQRLIDALPELRRVMQLD